MIVLNLTCENLHRFEGWFASSDEFAAQHTRGIVGCPVCGSHVITKLPSSPHVKRSARSDVTSDPAQAAVEQLAQSGQMMLMALTKRLLESSEDVGERFSEEARRIHYDEAPDRNIRGIASAEERQALLDEGIMVLAIPVPAKGEVH